MPTGKEMEALVQAVEAHPAVMTYPRPRNEMESLVHAIETHPEVLPHYKRNQTIKDVKNTWEMVAKELNARHVFKSAISGEEAKKKWSDLKYRTKKKAKALEKDQAETVVGDISNPDVLFISQYEERVLDLIKFKGLIKAPTTSQNSSVSSSHINVPTTSQNSIVLPNHTNVPSTSQNSIVLPNHTNASTPSLDTVLPLDHVIVKAQSSSINSSLQSGHIIVHAPSPMTLPSGHILIQASTPILPISTPSIIPDQSLNLSAHTPLLTPDPNLPASNPFLTDVCTVQTAANIKEEMFEIGEVETEPPLGNAMDEINNASVERVLCKNNDPCTNRKSRELFRKRKKRIKKTEFNMLADIERRKMALLEEQIKIKREHLKFQEKKTLIMEQQLAISKEQLAVSKEQLAVSKQILHFKINQGS